MSKAIITILPSRAVRREPITRERLGREDYPNTSLYAESTISYSPHMSRVSAGHGM